jgi:hypothetical protein
MILASLAIGEGGRRSIIPGRRPIPFPVRKFARIAPKPRFMNVMPRRGNWCIVSPNSLGRPLVCFDTYQEAREYDGVMPQAQGFNARGTERWVECERVSGTPSYISRMAHDEDRVFIRVAECINLTGKPRHRKDAEPLAGYRRR